MQTFIKHAKELTKNMAIAFVGVSLMVLAAKGLFIWVKFLWNI